MYQYSYSDDDLYDEDDCDDEFYDEINFMVNQYLYHESLGYQKELKIIKEER